MLLSWSVGKSKIFFRYLGHLGVILTFQMELQTARGQAFHKNIVPHLGDSTSGPSLKSLTLDFCRS